MCLITKQRKPKIAKRDMTCYKLVERISDDEFRAAYNTNFMYLKGNLYSTKIKQSYERSYFDDVAGAKYGLDTYNPDWSGLNILGEGFHSSRTVKRITMEHIYHTGVVVRCIIPAGSEYYTDTTGLIVSNQIIIKGIWNKRQK